MSKKQKQFCLALLAIVILLLIWLSKKHPAISQNLEKGGVAGTNTSAQIEKTSAPIRTPVTLAPTNEYQQILPQNEQKKQSMAQEALLWRTPILYYGKVVDESNQPILGVQVSFNTSSVNESLTKEQYDNGTVTTDDRGIFKIDGVHGVGMVFQLSHPNYYSYPENITDYDIRDYPKKGALPNTEDTALVFRMHSKGHPVPLIFRSGGFHAPNDGSIANFPLRGNTRAEILGQLQVQGWSGIRSDTNPYDWKVQLTMPEGGIIESTNYFDFLAPETGYSESVDFQVSGSEMARKQYFLKLPSGYVRFKLEVIMGKDMFVSGDYYYNPDGSQNLEPSQDIHPTQ
jgi:hypothetical protein